MRIKNSNILLAGITIFLLGMAFVTDAMLRGVYRKMDLDDPQKNLLTIPVLPFKALQLRGGNTYRIEIVQAPRWALKVLRSRQSFLDSSRSGDTLTIRWTVATNSNPSMEQPPIGLTIECPDLVFLNFSGTQNWVHAFNMNSLCIRQDGNTRTALEGSTIRGLDLEGSQTSWYDLKGITVQGTFSLDLKGEAGIRLRNIAWGRFSPLVAEKASVVLVGSAIRPCP